MVQKESDGIPMALRHGFVEGRIAKLAGRVHLCATFDQRCDFIEDSSRACNVQGAFSEVPDLIHIL